MSEKYFISAQQLLDDSFRLGLEILDSDFRPDFIVGVWRGGTPVGIVVQELLDYFGVVSDHIAIRTSSYEGIGKRSHNIRVHGLNYIVKNVNAEHSLLIVDDVWDTGLSIDAVIEHLAEESRRNTPHDIRVATAYYKPQNNKTDRAPDFYVHETDRWLVFPHELHGLEADEILTQKPGVAAILDRIRAAQPDQVAE
ncbi:MAG: hypoxanthine phosphoribosyltransferase [Gammaproteobacteria bacterium]|nr:hypoxanthine phosphoribosyltransferase [Gammaproteobacteria bacterium]